MRKPRTSDAHRVRRPSPLAGTYLDRMADEIMPATASHLLLAGVTSARELGTASANKKADIFAVRGDVLRYVDLLQNVDFVMKGGVVYKQDGMPAEENL